MFVGVCEWFLKLFSCRQREQLNFSEADNANYQVIPTPSHVLGRISPIFTPFFPFFARFHRLVETVPTSRKPEPRAKKQPARGPRGENSALRSTSQMLTKGSPGSGAATEARKFNGLTEWVGNLGKIRNNIGGKVVAMTD